MKKPDIEKLGRILGFEVKDVGDNVLVNCPFAKLKHRRGTDRNPSMSVKVNPHGESPFHCFACSSEGQSLTMMIFMLEGTAVSKETAREARAFVEQAESDLAPGPEMSYEEAIAPPKVVRLAVVPEGRVEVHSDEDFEREFGPVPTEHPYIRKRGLLPETAKLFGIGFDPAHERVVLPVRWHTGAIVGAIGRLARPPRMTRKGIPEQPYYNYWRFPKGLILFGEWLLRPEPVVVCEGPFDAIKVRQAGFNAVATMGAKFSEEQVAKIREWEQPVVVCFDPDETGREQSARLVRTLRRVNVLVTAVEPPEGKDAGSMSSADLKALLGPAVAPDEADFETPDYWGR